MYRCVQMGLCYVRRLTMCDEIRRRHYTDMHRVYKRRWPIYGADGCSRAAYPKPDDKYMFAAIEDLIRSWKRKKSNLFAYDGPLGWLCRRYTCAPANVMTVVAALIATGATPQPTWRKMTALYNVLFRRQWWRPCESCRQFTLRPNILKLQSVVSTVNDAAADADVDDQFRSDKGITVGG